MVQCPSVDPKATLRDVVLKLMGSVAPGRGD